MSNPSPTELANDLVDQVAHQADQAIKSTQGLSSSTMDKLSDGLRSIRAQGKPLIDGAADQASTLVHRGAQALHDGTQHMQDSARHASDSTVNYIRNEPVRSMLIAAAAGAAIVALAGWLQRSSSRN